MFITWDEAGGYWDSGYIQSIDFFGDGPRIPTPDPVALFDRRQGQPQLRRPRFAAEVHRAQLGLQPLTNRSRDNLPNPTVSKNNPYVPTNSPALADLFDAFDFDKKAVTSPTLE